MKIYIVLTIAREGSEVTGILGAYASREKAASEIETANPEYSYEIEVHELK